MTINDLNISVHTIVSPVMHCAIDHDVITIMQTEWVRHDAAMDYNSALMVFLIVLVVIYALSMLAKIIYMLSWGIIHALTRVIFWLCIE